MKRIEELQSKLDELEDTMPPNDLIYGLQDTLNYLGEMKDIKSNGQVRKQTRRLLYKLHDRFVINDE